MPRFFNPTLWPGDRVWNVVGASYGGSDKRFWKPLDDEFDLLSFPIKIWVLIKYWISLSEGTSNFYRISVQITIWFWTYKSIMLTLKASINGWYVSGWPGYKFIWEWHSRTTDFKVNRADSDDSELRYSIILTSWEIT